MSDENYSKGSEWRKWDLHIHTPASFHWNGGKRFFEMTPVEKDDTLQKMFDTINNSDIAVFAITDYWTFDGYLEFKNYIRRKELQLNKVIFPGMELRVEAPVDYRLNIQVILSDELTPQQLKDFKSKLKIGSINRNLSDDALKDFAKSLDESKAKSHGFKSPENLSDSELLELGSKTAEITKESLCKDAFDAIPDKSGYILLPFETSDGLAKLDWKTHPHADNYFMQSADIFESRNDEIIDLFSGKETPANKEFIKNFIKTLGGRIKPVVSGSDAHKIEDFGKYPNERVTWIKADPGFKGLQQVINEPAERAYVGALPQKLVEVDNAKSKYISSIRISHTNLNETSSWFKGEIPINSGLVAIIGKKGNGKSALADILSLCGDSKIEPAYYSFLTPHKFRKRNLARNYNADLEWFDGRKSQKNLDEDVIGTSPERVKYLPQQYVENICNEEGVSDLFQKEIDKVIFSYVPEESRLGTCNLSELIKTKTESVNEAISSLRIDLHNANEGIIALEEKENPKYIEGLNKKLEDKKRELKNLSKPKAIKKPKTTLNKKTEQKISKINESIGAIKEEIKEARAKFRDTNDKIHKVDKILASANTISNKVAEFINTFKEDASELSIDLSKIIKFEIVDDALSLKREELSTLKGQLEKKLEETNPDSSASFYNKKKKLETDLVNITSSLDDEQKLYKKYLQDLKIYEEKKDLLMGSYDDYSLETILSIENAIDFVKNKLLESLQALHKKRDGATRKIFKELERKIDFYGEIYSPIVKFIESEKETQKKSGSALNFTAGLTFGRTKFIDDFLSFINQGRNGSFQTSEGARNVLNGLIEKYDFSKEESVCRFIDDVIDHLRTDKTQPDQKANHIKSQLKRDQLDFYDFLFGLEYLDVKYKILFNGKDLNANEFSPGEKGALLLIFYLLIDKDNIPLIIDQPEENLDNESVYTILVPYIKKAKNKRQIIAVTHNPNLAVVCDAEQIVCASMDKKKSEIRYVSGSIENLVINKKIVDILEGTLPAFSIRDKKYIRKIK